MFEDRKKSDRQYLCELLDKKTERLLNESKYSVEAIEAALRKCESMISDSGEQNVEGIKELCKILNMHDTAVKKTLKSIQRDMEKDQVSKKEFGEKLELTESEIRMLLLNSVMDQLP
ncbi:MAG: hypothetical protein HDR13_07790 [Lachnospiraceae bacterium]|nr:hypothetical protein [Lachnospiraceae bacterium]